MALLNGKGWFKEIDISLINFKFSVRIKQSDMIMYNIQVTGAKEGILQCVSFKWCITGRF